MFKPPPQPKQNKEDVSGLLKDRLNEGKKALDDAIEELENYVSLVEQPKKVDQFFDFFVYDQTTAAENQMAVTIENSNKREGFYNKVNKLITRYLAIASQMVKAGYTEVEAHKIHDMVSDYSELRDAIMLRSADLTDLRQYNAMMRKLLDRYVHAPQSEVLAKLDDFTFLSLVDINLSAKDNRSKIITKFGGKESGIAETISANIRKYIVRKRDQNPNFYDKLSARLNKLLEDYRQKAIEYKDMLLELIDLMKQMKQTTGYPNGIDSPLKQALYDNLNKDEALTLEVYKTISDKGSPNWREIPARIKRLKNAISKVIGLSGEELDSIMSIIMANDEF